MALRIRLLGELALLRDGKPVALPASKKTRALLGYLVATLRPHRRERLCDLLWDGPDDPRAELRWSLSKLRPLLDDDRATRLVADRERVGFAAAGAAVDLVEIRALLEGGAASASTAALEAAAGRFGGAFLDGLDLPLCWRFQDWCASEREAVGRLHLAVLAALVERLADRPADALPHARALAAADPLAEPGQAAVVRLLAGLGRHREALAQYDHARRLFETELGAPPSAELEEARRALRPAASAPPPAGPPAEPRADRPARPAATAFIGRPTVRTAVDRIVSAAFARQDPEVVLVTGEPGIGKSHLLAHLRERMASAGGGAVAARAFEAEAARPYGPWIDTLRAMARERPLAAVADLGLLLPELGVPADHPGDRSRLFDAVLALVRRLAADRPLTVTLDDLQWVDEASAALLHYLARQAPAGLVLACAARSGEIDDNAAAAGALRSLRRDGRLREIALAALSPRETAELVRTVDRGRDPARVYAESRGNPLFTLALARAPGRSDVEGEGGAGRTVDTLIAGQLARLRDPARDLLAWAAALERSFTPDALCRIAGCAEADLFAALDELERRGLVEPAGGDAYDFVHDLVRRAAYRGLSPPRRSLIHRRIARALSSESDPALAGDAAHHAALGGDHALALGACVAAGDHALRLFANAEAAGFAERGLRHADRLPPGPAAAEARIALLRIRMLAAAGPGMRPLPPLAEAVAQAVAAAEALDLHAAAATGHHLLSVLHQEAGDRGRAEDSTLRAAAAGRPADRPTQARQLANTARCLVELETQIPRARALVREAGAIAAALGIELCELAWAQGLLERWDGDAEAAARSLDRTLALARAAEDRWREYKCLTWVAVLEFERGRAAALHARCAELIAVAARLGEDGTPFVATLEALARPSPPAALAEALDQLRAVDDKSYLAYALNAAAELRLRRGDPAAARARAAEALAVASLMRRPNEIAIARALLARSGDEPSMRALASLAADPDGLSARARSALAAAAGAAGASPLLPTLAPHA